MPSFKILNERLAQLEAHALRRPLPKFDMRILTLPQRDYVCACMRDRELLSLTPSGLMKYINTNFVRQNIQLLFQCRFFPRDTPKEITEAPDNQSPLMKNLEAYFLDKSKDDKSIPNGDFDFENLRAHIYIHLRNLCEKYGFDVNTGSTKEIVPIAEWSDEDYRSLCGILMLALPSYDQSRDVHDDFQKMKIDIEVSLEEIYLKLNE